MASLTIFLLLFIGVLNVDLAWCCSPRSSPSKPKEDPRHFYVVAPKAFRLNSDETVAIVVEAGPTENVRILIQDYPIRINTIYRSTVAVQPGTPRLTQIRLYAEKFPIGSTSHVVMTMSTDSHSREYVIPVKEEYGYVFLQMDKPVYTPNQKANMMIIALNEKVSPSSEVFHLQIKNPNGTVVEETPFNVKTSRENKGLVTHSYTFPEYPNLGLWSATVRYGHKLRQETTAFFELREYVLPTFTVKLTVPDVILPTTKTIPIGIVAKYVYGENVKGVASVRLGVKRSASSRNIIFFDALGPKELKDGTCSLSTSMELLKDVGIQSFSELENFRLVIEATVLDTATGTMENATYDKVVFSKSPVRFSFQRLLVYFQPGLVTFVEANLYYHSGKPAKGVKTRIEAVNGRSRMTIAQNSAVSDENGKVIFQIQPEIQDNFVTITLTTDDPRFGNNQAVGQRTIIRKRKTGNSYIALARNSMGSKLQPGDMFSRLIHYEPAELNDIYYVVTTKGRILFMNKSPRGRYKTRQVDFKITHDMIPSFRVTVFAHTGSEMLADSLKFEVEKVCHPNAEVSIIPEFNIKEPGQSGKILIRGNKGNQVGLLGVDEAVYALSKKDILTKDKVLERIGKHDLGTGPGSDRTVEEVLSSSGVIVDTNKRPPASEESSGGGGGGGGFSFMTSMQRFPWDSSSGVQVHQDKASFDDFLPTGVMFDDDDFIPVEEEDFWENGLTVRSDFRETWIFERISIGQENQEIYDTRLPHSITTWFIQAVSVSSNHGICVAEPQKLVSFKKLFLHLNLPYSVVRNEEVEIQATIFNYGDETIPAVTYMYGANDLCSGSQPGKKSRRRRLIVNGHSAETVIFHVIPLKAVDLPIKVVVLTTGGSDVIQKYLHVVPEGVTKEIDIPIKLDPSNKQRRVARYVNSERYNDTIDPSQNLQVTAVELSLPENIVPGTASCSITAIGDPFGPVIETTINDPESLLQLPYGCGEQNMRRLAPTLYTMRYLNVSGKLTTAHRKGYDYIRKGFEYQLTFRKADGSFVSFKNSVESNTWLTAFVMKVFCQASKLVNIEKYAIDSGVRWLTMNQEVDGSFKEIYGTYYISLMGGEKGKLPLTAFTLIALEECKSGQRSLLAERRAAMTYLESRLSDVDQPLVAALVAYALALSNSELKHRANANLLSMSQTNTGANMMYWETSNSAQDIETAGYALLIQLLHGDMVKSGSIVNWLNTKQSRSGGFKSTQDTMVALQALSEYAIHTRKTPIDLVTKISCSNDRSLNKTLRFSPENALVLQELKLNTTGGTLFVNTTGHGEGSLYVKLRYNLIEPLERISKFDVRVDFKEAAEDETGTHLFDTFAQSIRNAMGDSNGRKKRDSEAGKGDTKYKISTCVRYLGDTDAEMSIVDVGLFSGFKPVMEDLNKLVKDPNHLIQMFEKIGRGVVFYLVKVPTRKNYCFSFHVVRDYVVSNTQLSVVKVYDYYNPDAVTTKFYSPDGNNPEFYTVCEKGVCKCAESVQRNNYNLISK